MTDAADVLRSAADLIERRGLHKRDFINPNQPPETAALCALGAIDVASGLWRPTTEQNGRTYLLDRTDIPLEERFERRHLAQEAAQALNFTLRMRGLITDITGKAWGVISWNDLPETRAKDVVKMLRAAADQLSPTTLTKVRFIDRIRRFFT